MEQKSKNYLHSNFALDELGRVIINDKKTLDMVNAAAAGPVPTNYLDIYCNNLQDKQCVHKNLSCTDMSCKFPNSSCFNPCVNPGCP